MTQVMQPPHLDAPHGGAVATTLPEPRRAWVAVLGVLTFLTIAYGAVALADLLVHTSSTTPSSFASVTALDARTDGSVHITAAGEGSEGSVKVDRRIERGILAPDASEKLVGSELRLRGSCPVVMTVYCGVTYEVQAPPGISVDAHSTGGAVTVSGMSGSVTASSSGGEIVLSDLSGPVVATSSAGPVRLEAMRSDTVRASTSAGSVKVALLVAPSSVDARSSAGPVEVVVPDDGTSYRVDAGSSAGPTRIEVRTDPAASRVITARSSAGGVTVRYAR